LTFEPACPICHRRVFWEDNPYRPFCSRRCQMIDLGAWVTERYRLPGEEIAPAEDDSEEQGGKNNGGK